MTIPRLDIYGSNARLNYPMACACTQSQTETSAVGTTTNTTVSVTLAAALDARSENLAATISQAFWSYSGGAQTGGRLVITDGGVTIFDQDLSANQGQFNFTPPKSAVPGNAMVVSLYPGGAGVTGKLVLNAWYQA